MFSTGVGAQSILMGKITSGMSEDEPVGNIMLETSSGSTSFSNESGLFKIQYQPKDTLFFYYQGKRTLSFLMDTINPQNFYVPLYQIRHRVMEGAKSRFNSALLPVDTSYNNVTVKNRNYSQDSLDRRKEYGKAFGYTKPKMKFGEDWTPTSLNVGKLYETLNGSKKKKNQMLKDNLIREEEEGYITNRFNPTFVSKYLGEKVSEHTLEDYMKVKRPTFEFLQGIQDLELIDYIRKSFAAYKKEKGLQ
ncbi:MAG: hypothetical protein DI598_05790 [Pseudopedobacter saltans]|uniref:Carboxypeptidase-like regulatory domain-containing protein n=1 Tax=Pseudopedobacter saltans TaxID=151895 RepID=A0A2W5F6D8_9SPHI|nr:MAG: hypothetical protein DI598_05790 [Pseudopedobacter saltans]